MAVCEPDRSTSKPIVFHWFAHPPGAERFFFAGVWCQCEGTVERRRRRTSAKRLLFSSLTTDANGVAEPLHEKAMPVLIRIKDEAEQRF